MTTRKRLLIVGAFPPPTARIVGGVATSCRVLLESSLPQRAELLLVDSSQISNPPPGLLVRLLLAVRRCGRFLWNFERGRPSAVMLFTSPGASSLEKGVLAWYARLRGKKALLLPRGNAPEQFGNGIWARWYLALCFGGAHRIICQGKAWQGFALRRLGRAMAEVPIVRNWTATEAYLSIGRQRVFGAETPVKLIYVGWAEEEKGVLDLLDACARLAPGTPYELDIVGDGNAIPQVEAWIVAQGATSRVRTHGWLGGAEKLALLRTADLFVLPSWSEGLPNAMIEAMACKIACVMTDVGNIRDAVGENVVLVPRRDIAALAQALNAAIADPTLRRTLAQRGFECAEQEFRTERAVDQLLASVG